MDRGLTPRPVREEAGAPRRRGHGIVGRGELRLDELGTAADGFHGYGFDHELLALVDEAEAGAMRLLEGLFHIGERARGHLERRIGSRVTYVRTYKDGDVCLRDTLSRDFCGRVGAEPRAKLLDASARTFVEWLLHCL